MKDKTIVVTGAAGRLGRHILDRLHGSGARIVALVLNKEEADRVAGRAALVVQTDVTNEESAIEAFSRIAREMESLDGLIHTVGGWGMTPLQETTASEWESMMRLNLTSTFLCFREASRLMADGGVLVAMSSGQGADGGVSEQGAYSAAKAGVLRLVEALGGELEDQNIRTLAVAPSMILFDEAGDQDGVPVADVVEACLSPFGENPPPSGSLIRVYGSMPMD